jgi:hypothetical protein
MTLAEETKNAINAAFDAMGINPDSIEIDVVDLDTDRPYNFVRASFNTVALRVDYSQSFTRQYGDGAVVVAFQTLSLGLSYCTAVLSEVEEMHAKGRLR